MHNIALTDEQLALLSDTLFAAYDARKTDSDDPENDPDVSGLRSVWNIVHRELTSTKLDIPEGVLASSTLRAHSEFATIENISFCAYGKSSSRPNQPKDRKLHIRVASIVCVESRCSIKANPDRNDFPSLRIILSGSPEEYVEAWFDANNHADDAYTALKSALGL